MESVGETLGVEEEFHLVDRDTLQLKGVAKEVLERAKCEEVTSEILTCQVESATKICSTLEEVRSEVERTRGILARAAGEEGAYVLPQGFHPLAGWKDGEITPKVRYVHLEEKYGHVARLQLIAGCHVHVSLPDVDMAARVSRRVGEWGCVLLALSGNSALFEGADTQYSSFRTMWFAHFPNTGPAPALSGKAEMDAVVERLARTGVVDDATNLYWDVRPSVRYPTLEMRMCDVAGSVDEAVMVAGLTRAVVRKVCEEDVEREWSFGVVEAMRWRAARWGVSGELVDPRDGEVRSAGEVVEGMLAWVREDLESRGEWEEVSQTARRVIAEGNAAERQRRLFAEGGWRRAVEGFVLPG